MLAYAYKLMATSVLADSHDPASTGMGEPRPSTDSPRRGDDELVDAGTEDRCQLCSHQPDPEPQAAECDTCVGPTTPTMMITCDAESNCSYTQCLGCVLKGGAMGCGNPECMQLHYKCPACREQVFGEGLMLTDERLTKDDVLQVLRTTRDEHAQQARAVMEEVMSLAAADLTESL
jgi:hypothetical protein